MMEFCDNSLLFALKLGHADIVEYLLSKGANPDGFMDPENHQSCSYFLLPSEIIAWIWLNCCMSIRPL